MVKDTRVVVGSFNTQDEVKTILRDLKTGGYRQEDITLYADPKNIDQLRNSQDVAVKTNEVPEPHENSNQKGEESDQSFWDQVKDLFSTDADNDMYLSDQTGPQANNLLSPYKEDISNGNIVVVVNNYRGDANVDTDTNQTVDKTATTDTNIVQTSVREPRDTDEGLPKDEKMQLKEERLYVDKEEVQTGEVNIRKETRHDTETVEVPVEREEVIIERKPVTGKDTETSETEFNEETESYTIPVKEDKVTVDKKPVIKEEVEIKKKRDKDIETVSEDIAREELNVERKGRTGAEGTRDNIDSTK